MKEVSLNISDDLSFLPLDALTPPTRHSGGEAMKAAKCKTCDGTGKIIKVHNEALTPALRYMACPACKPRKAKR